jgi:hypothetical protein
VAQPGVGDEVRHAHLAQQDERGQTRKPAEQHQHCANDFDHAGDTEQGPRKQGVEHCIVRYVEQLGSAVLEEQDRR